MFERFERPVRILCLVLGAVLAWQLAGLVMQSDPLAKLKIPALPTLAGGTNENRSNGTNMTHGANMVKTLKKTGLSREAQARVDKILDSEIFGPVVRPMPIALIGIADREAFLQATNGQIGPVKVGGELGGIKLLRIGINRVLVENDGEKKELTLFGGAGGESLMPKSTNTPTNQTLSVKLKDSH